MLQQQMLNFALLGAGWVLWLLVGLSVLVLAVTIERSIYGIFNTTPAAEFQSALGAFFSGGPATDLRDRLDKLKGVEARVLAAGVSAAIEGGPPAAEEAIIGTLAMERIKLERGLIIIGTVGANAPFLGLFGTVLGIIKAFHDLSLESAEAATGVMAGISEALVATGVGLMVAIPAVVLYNWFQRRNKEHLARVESLSHLVLSRFKGERSPAEGADLASARSA